MITSPHGLLRAVTRGGAGLLALTLLVAACGSDGDGTAASDDATTTTAGETAATPSTAQADDGSGSGGADGTEAEDGSADTATSESSILPTEQILAGLGIEVSDELLGCLADRGVGDEFDVSEGLGEAGAAVMGCAPEEMGSMMASMVVVEGLTPEQIECVMVELARAAGELSPEDARTAFGSEVSEVPESLRTAVLDSAPAACGVSGEQVEAVLNAE